VTDESRAIFFSQRKAAAKVTLTKLKIASF